jgi:glycosyltransferase involved in cell wall biosynthesis
MVKQLEQIQKSAIADAEVNVVFSENMQRQLKDLKVKSKKTVQLNPGVDTSRFIASADVKKTLKKAYAFSQSDMVILAIGRVIKAKGFHKVIKALASTQNTSLKLVIVGDGPEKTALEQLSDELEMNGRVHFFSGTNAPEKFYQLADIFVMSSTYESFGQTILEAMSSGLIIVGMKSNFNSGIITATSEIVEHEKNGFLVDDAGGLVKAFNVCLKLSSDDRVLMAASNRSKVEEHYQWSELAQNILNLAEGL